MPQASALVAISPASGSTDAGPTSRTRVLTPPSYGVRPSSPTRVVGEGLIPLRQPGDSTRLGIRYLMSHWHHGLNSPCTSFISPLQLRHPYPPHRQNGQRHSRCLIPQTADSLLPARTDNNPHAPAPPTVGAVTSCWPASPRTAAPPPLPLLPYSCNSNAPPPPPPPPRLPTCVALRTAATIFPPLFIFWEEPKRPQAPWPAPRTTITMAPHASRFVGPLSASRATKTIAPRASRFTSSWSVLHPACGGAVHQQRAACPWSAPCAATTMAPRASMFFRRRVAFSGRHQVLPRQRVPRASRGSHASGCANTIMAPRAWSRAPRACRRQHTPGQHCVLP